MLPLTSSCSTSCYLSCACIQAEAAEVKRLLEAAQADLETKAAEVTSLGTKATGLSGQLEEAQQKLAGALTELEGSRGQVAAQGQQLQEVRRRGVGDVGEGMVGDVVAGATS
jgi:chromosome segregation ATPase